VAERATGITMRWQGSDESCDGCVRKKINVRHVGAERSVALPMVGSLALVGQYDPLDVADDRVTTRGVTALAHAVNLIAQRRCNEIDTDRNEQKDVFRCSGDARPERGDAVQSACHPWALTASRMDQESTAVWHP
jgi:hypothetical protein